MSKKYALHGDAYKRPNSEVYLWKYVKEHPTVDSIDVYQVICAAG